GAAAGDRAGGGGAEGIGSGGGQSPLEYIVCAGVGIAVVGERQNAVADLVDAEGAADKPREGADAAVAGAAADLDAQVLRQSERAREDDDIVVDTVIVDGHGAGCR